MAGLFCRTLRYDRARARHIPVYAPSLRAAMPRFRQKVLSHRCSVGFLARSIRYDRARVRHIPMYAPSLRAAMPRLRQKILSHRCLGGFLAEPSFLGRAQAGPSFNFGRNWESLI